MYPDLALEFGARTTAMGAVRAPVGTYSAFISSIALIGSFPEVSSV